MNHKTDLIEYISAYTRELARGQSIIVPCPDCQSDMEISRSRGNGHIWVTCPRCGVKMSS